MSIELFDYFLRLIIILFHKSIKSKTVVLCRLLNEYDCFNKIDMFVGFCLDLIFKD